MKHKIEIENLESSHNAAMSELLDMKLEGISTFSTPSKNLTLNNKNNSNNNTRSRSSSNSNSNSSAKDSGKEPNVSIASMLNELASVQSQLLLKTEENESLKKILSQNNNSSNNNTNNNTNYNNNNNNINNNYNNLKKKNNDFYIPSGSPIKPNKKSFLPISLSSSSSTFSLLKRSPSLDESLRYNNSYNNNHYNNNNINYQHYNNNSISINDDVININNNDSNDNNDMSSFNNSQKDIENDTIQSIKEVGIIVPFRPDPLGSGTGVNSDGNVLLYDAAAVEAALAELRKGADKLVSTPFKTNSNNINNNNENNNNDNNNNYNKINFRRFSESDVKIMNNVYYDMDLSRDEEVEDLLSYADSMSPIKNKLSIKPFMRTSNDLTIFSSEQEEDRNEEVNMYIHILSFFYISFFIHLFICLFTYLFVCLFVYSLIYLFISLFIHSN